MRRSRLTKRTEKQTKNSIILSLLGIIIILFLFFKFGLGILINFSLFLSGKGQDNGISASNQINFVSVPVLNPLPSATNSASIVISGSTTANSKVHLFINGSKVDESDANEKGGFTFSETLDKGNNEIKARTEFKNKTSEFSDSQNVLISNNPPTLEITYPNDGDSFKKDQNTVKVAGKTDSGASVTVNGFYAIIDENNNFSYILPLQNGETQVKIIAIDQAGNKTEKDLKINYSQ